MQRPRDFLRRSPPRLLMIHCLLFTQVRMTSRLPALGNCWTSTVGLSSSTSLSPQTFWSQEFCHGRGLTASSSARPSALTTAYRLFAESLTWSFSTSGTISTVRESSSKRTDYTCPPSGQPDSEGSLTTQYVTPAQKTALDQVPPSRPCKSNA